jgi:LacI family transcriptional regulator
MDKMPKGSATLRDVATAAGVHPGTASRALNEETRSLVRSETVERILFAAEQLGYKPNLLARSFKTRRTNSVGIVIPDINNPLFPPMVRGVEDRLFDSGFVTLLANTEGDPDRQRKIFESMVDRRVDGLVLATASRKDDDLAMFAAEGIPIVLINRVVEDATFSSVSVDDVVGVRMAVDHLRNLGHVRIGHVAGPQSMSTGHARYHGFLSSMAASGAPADPELVAFAEQFSVAEGERCATALLEKKRRPSAIVAGNDMLALGAVSAVEHAGLRCPEDVSIVGFNDMPFVDRLHPPLTTVRIPHYSIGARAADLLVELVRDQRGPLRVVVLAPELVVRQSTLRVPAATR